MTLLDMAIALLVISLLLTPSIYAYNIWRIDKDENLTDNNIRGLEQAISEFYFENGRYPCPANIALPTTDPNFGIEDCPGPATAAPVLQGGVPIKTLRIPPILALDGWSQRMMYAVTQAQSNLNIPGFNFNPSGGMIRVSGFHEEEDPVTFESVCKNTPPTAPYANYPNYPDGFYATPGSAISPGAHYVLLSMGQSGVGARTAEGNLIQACPTGGSAPLDSRNCDGDDNFWMRICSYNANSGTNHYDDMLHMVNEPPPRIWTPSAAAGGDNDTVTSSQFIGIGTPNPKVTLDVVGNIKTDSGNTHSDTFCDNTAYEWGGVSYAWICFNPTLITGNDPNMTCPSTNAMKGIYYNQANCTVSYIPARQSFCLANQLMVGITETGQAVCQEL